MSDTVFKQGDLIPLGPGPCGADETQWERVTAYLRDAGVPEHRDDWPDELLFKYAIFLNGQWYRDTGEEVSVYEAPITVEVQADGSISYICIWYNGGGAFQEVIEDSLDRK